MFQQISSHIVNSPYYESVTHGFTAARGRITRPADTNSYLVISSRPKHLESYFVGPWESAAELVYGADAEIIWIRLSLGVHINRTPSVRFRNWEFPLSSSAANEICLGGEFFAIPKANEVDIFMDHLVRSGALVLDPMIGDAMLSPNELPPERSRRDRFLSSVGISKRSIIQIRKAQRAVELLAGGDSIADVVFSLGYCDQSHLTRNVVKYIGQTPGKLRRLERCQNVQDVRTMN